MYTDKRTSCLSENCRKPRACIPLLDSVIQARAATTCRCRARHTRSAPGMNATDTVFICAGLSDAHCRSPRAIVGTFVLRCTEWSRYCRYIHRVAPRNIVARWLMYYVSSSAILRLIAPAQARVISFAFYGDTRKRVAGNTCESVIISMRCLILLSE